MVILLAHMYNFGVSGDALIYDILRRHCDSFKQVDIEIVHTILKYCGFQLRSDDPIALRDLIVSMQPKVTETKNSIDGKRVMFMLETITAVKNNRKRVVDEQLDARVVPFKKAMRAFIKRKNGTRSEEGKVR